MLTHTCIASSPRTHRLYDSSVDIIPRTQQETCFDGQLRTPIASCLSPSPMTMFITLQLRTWKYRSGCPRKALGYALIVNHNIILPRMYSLKDYKCDWSNYDCSGHMCPLYERFITSKTHHLRLAKTTKRKLVKTVQNNETVTERQHKNKAKVSQVSARISQN
jgi:hypothetical protein